MTHYPTLEADVVDRARLRGIDVEASTNAFLLQIRTGRCKTRAGHDLFMLPLRPARPVAASVRELTPSEEQLMPYLASGYTVPEIAERLRKSPETVTKQKRDALRKLGAVNGAHGTALWILRRFEATTHERMAA